MENKRLQRVTGKDTQIGGVSIGLADYFNVDTTLIRVIFVILIFTPFPAIITYIILWAVLPIRYEELSGVSSDTHSSNMGNLLENPLNQSIMKNKNNQGSLVGGAILIILGIIFSFKTFFHINLFHYIGQMWPLFLIALGVWLVIREKTTDKIDPFDNDAIGGSSSKDNFQP